MGKKKTIEKLENIENPTVSTDCIDDNEPLQAEKIPVKPIQPPTPEPIQPPPTPEAQPQSQSKPKRKQKMTKKKLKIKILILKFILTNLKRQLVLMLKSQILKLYPLIVLLHHQEVII